MTDATWYAWHTLGMLRGHLRRKLDRGECLGECDRGTVSAPMSMCLMLVDGLESSSQLEKKTYHELTEHADHELDYRYYMPPKRKRKNSNDLRQWYATPNQAHIAQPHAPCTPELSLACHPDP